MNSHLMLVRRTALALALLLTAIFLIAGQDKDQCNAVKVTLLQVNDVYQFAPVDQGTKGGLGRVLTLRKSIQQENPNTLLLMSGDTISPSVESITYKGAQMIET
jgi:2',3'-cyclic-nucleotide 2'-phosphodiesterase (5'-nucleotidase family)